MQEWRDNVFLDKSRFCLQHHTGRIRVWQHCEDRTLPAFIQHRYTGPPPGAMYRMPLATRFGHLLFILTAL